MQQVPFYPKSETHSVSSPIKSMTVVRYYQDGLPWEAILAKDPTWQETESAIRQMDNVYFPIVLLSCQEFDDGNALVEDEDAPVVIGAADKCTVFHMMGEWQYTEPGGDTSEVRLWESDQGYVCQEQNLIRDVEKALRIIKAYYDSGSYDGLDNVR